MSALIRTSMLEPLSFRLATSRGGRVALHLACMAAGSDRAMHWQGIVRELRGQ